MSLPQHILIATDFSTPAERAIRKGAALALKLGARVSLVHSYDPSAVVPPGALPNARQYEQTIGEEMREAANKELTRTRESVLGDVPEVVTHAMVGRNPARAICSFAEENAVDLIVVGTHGRTGLAHLLIGSVAEKIVRHAPCSVLTVR